MSKLNQALHQSKSAYEWGLFRWVRFQGTYLERGYWSRWNTYWHNQKIKH